MSTPTERGRIMRESVFRPKGEEKLLRATRKAAQRAIELDPERRLATTFRVPGRRINLMLFDTWLYEDIAAWPILLQPAHRQELWLGQNGQLYSIQTNCRIARKPKLVNPATLDIDYLIELPKWLGRHFDQTLRNPQKGK